MNSFYLFMQQYGFSYISVLIVAILGILIIKNLLRIVEKVLISSTLDNSLIGFVITILRIVLYILLLFICLSRLNIPLGGIVSTISALTLAIGLAVQDIIGGVANGLMMVTSKLFKVDDYVDIGDYSGSVKEIKLLHTVLVTPDNKTITIPNKTVFSSSITNYSVYKVRRLDTVYTIDFDSDVEKAKKTLLDLALSCDMVLKDPSPMTVVKEKGEYSVSILLRVWVSSSDYWNLTWFLNEEGMNVLKESGVTLPYPQVTVSYREEEKR